MTVCFDVTCLASGGTTVVRGWPGIGLLADAQWWPDISTKRT